jgi:Na+-driven multidrug efflux pump
MGTTELAGTFQHDESATPRTMNRRVLGLAWPVVGEHLIETLLGVVDTMLVALRISRTNVIL